MKYLIILLITITHFTNFAQSEYSLQDFSDEELHSFNHVNDFKRYDFSKIIMENRSVLGIIGKSHQRLKMKLISIIKNPKNEKEYFVTGKSKVKNNICAFKGIITINKILLVENPYFGVDDEFYKRVVKNQGVLKADYLFIEDKKQKYTGIFKGKLHSKYILTKKGEINSDITGRHKDNFINNAFIGIWKSNNTKKSKICNWADGRVPMSNEDFDIGAAEFSPNEKYLDKGWNNYSQAWVHQQKAAQDKENEVWWE